MTTQSEKLNLNNPRAANAALWLGVAMAFALTALIWVMGDRLAAVPHLPDQGPLDYYWKLADPTTLTRAVAWGSYLAHQVFSWGLIYYAQTKVKTYTPGLHPINVIALLGNAAFSAWHIAQTHLFYDALAQDVSILTSQGSVIVMLVWILLMENKRRGLFAGKKISIGQTITSWARKYHGYFFSWAIIYTFWYHPAENTPGHLIGFLYMFLLMLQGSLFFTRLHVNKYWTVFQEVAVLFHGALVATQQGNNLWPMFFFGFGAIFLLTQMWGLGLPAKVKIGFVLAYGAAAVAAYWGRPAQFFAEVIRIPAIEYLAVFLLAGIIGLPFLFVRGARKLRGA